MKPLVLFIILICFIHNNSFAQINESIKKKSTENSQKRNQKSYSNDAYYYGDGCDVGACIDGCGCSLELASIIFDGLGVAQENTLSRINEFPKLSSIDLSCQLGQADQWNWSIIPKVKLRHGILSSELRLYQSFEDHIAGENNYSTLDWQIIMFNVINYEMVHWRFGTGILYENFSGQGFNEHSTTFELYPINNYVLTFEYRIAADYKTGVLVRQEINLGASFEIYKSQTLEWRGFFNYTFANYYEEVTFNIYSIGINLNIPFYN